MRNHLLMNFNSRNPLFYELFSSLTEAISQVVPQGLTQSPQTKVRLGPHAGASRSALVCLCFELLSASPPTPASPSQPQDHFSSQPMSRPPAVSPQFGAACRFAKFNPLSRALRKMLNSTSTSISQFLTRHEVYPSSPHLHQLNYKAAMGYCAKSLANVEAAPSLALHHPSHSTIPRVSLFISETHQHDLLLVTLSWLFPITCLCFKYLEMLLMGSRRGRSGH